MFLTIRQELIAFVTAVSSGIAVRMCYHCLTCFRRIVKHKHLVTELEDMVFWISSGIYLFVQIYHTSNGSIRWYFALGVVIGVLISTVFLRKWKKMTKKIYDFHAGKNIAKNEKKRYYNRY